MDDNARRPLATAAPTDDRPIDRPRQPVVHPPPHRPPTSPQPTTPPTTHPISQSLPCLQPTAPTRHTNTQSSSSNTHPLALRGALGHLELLHRVALVEPPHLPRARHGSCARFDVDGWMLWSVGPIDRSMMPGAGGRARMHHASSHRSARACERRGAIHSASIDARRERAPSHPSASQPTACTTMGATQSAGRWGVGNGVGGRLDRSIDDRG